MSAGQSLEEKAAAIASVLWLLPDHYTCLRLVRSGCRFVNELEQSDTPSWSPPIPEEFDGWPVEQVLAWFRYQRRLSAKYRLWAVGLAMQRLEREHPEQATAVVMECIEGGVYTWYEPGRVADRCRAGLLFMAADVPGDVPFFQEAVVAAAWPVKVRRRNREIVRLSIAGKTQREIAAEVGCSKNTVGAVLRGKRLVNGRAVPLNPAPSVRRQCADVR